ncbi:unnamed protein product [Cyprideis torosa]|uniref:4-hydroxy-tetrahydrodipicolinate synthase n=1 Tax=Cyprideis torosa TaxID=163714 RepID=A0A7R8W3P6_9CRUS|nr:unnamed protein product [Cyprideis torosa]CAG0878764.1 unnamed protein product [Cyprideis torosa]
MVALVTPFTSNGVDEQALRRLVEWHIASGTDALVPVGTTGESPVLSHKEHIRIVEVVVEAANGKLPVIAGAGSNNPLEAIEYTKAAQSAGADAVLSVAGYYNRPSQEGIFQHFSAIHDVTDIPIILYNIPSRCVVEINVETVARLAELPRIVGVKDATGDMSRLTAERKLIADDFAWLSGDDFSALAYNATGGCGCISVIANVAPALLKKFQMFCKKGDYFAARTLHEKLYPLQKALVLEPNPAGVKYATSLLGFGAETCRLPSVTLQDTTKALIKSLMLELELL